MKGYGRSIKACSIRWLVVLFVFAFAGHALGQPKFVYVANQTSDDISAYTVDSATGALTAILGSPFGAGLLFSPTALAVDPSAKFLYVADQCSFLFTCLPPPQPFPPTVNGGVWAFTIDSTTGALTTVPGSPFAAGLNPVSLAVHPSGKFVYVVNLNANANLQGVSPAAVSAFTIDSTTGVLSPVSGSPFPAEVVPISVVVHPSGKFAYVVNAISRDISAYSINSTTGALTSIGSFGAGIAPRWLAIHPSGKFAYVTNVPLPPTPSTVSVFTIDGATGALTSVGSPVITGVSSDSVAMDPLGGLAYVGNSASNNVSGYAIDTTTGALTAVSGSPFPVTSPSSVAVDPSGKFAYVTSAPLPPTLSSVSAFTIGANGALTLTGSFPAGLDSGSMVITGQTGVPPSQQITNLMNTVNSLNLPQGIAGSLNAPLLAAQASLAANNTIPACNQMNAFINYVMAQSGKELTVAQASDLIAQANLIMTGLGCH